MRTRARTVVAVGGSVLVLLLAGCGDGGGDGSDGTAVSPEVSHVHGVSVSSADGTVFIATHEGLMSFDGDRVSSVSDLNSDLMGFAVGEEGRFYASGHPGEGEDGPFALGLITSSNGGESWEPVSLSGEADFHALDAWSEGVVGYDGISGALLRSTDEGATWSELPLEEPVTGLAADEEGRLVATTESGPQLSEDGGADFEVLAGAPLLVRVDFTSQGRLVGLDPDGTVHVSDDLTQWTTADTVEGEVQAMTVAPDGDVWVATEEGLQRGDQDGTGFSSVVEW